MTNSNGGDVYRNIHRKFRNRFVLCLRLKLAVYLLGVCAALLLPAAAAAASPERIVSLAPNATEILFAIGAGDAVVAVDAFSDYPAAAAGLPHIDAFNPSVEGFAALAPDLVIVTFDPSIIPLAINYFGKRV